MKKLITALCLITSASFGQEKCISEIMFQEAAKQNPELLNTRQRLEEYTQSWVEQNGTAVANRSTGSAATYVIPVVFHIIHRGGVENITDAQVLSQIESVNLDYRRMNADTVNTAPPFAAIAADCDVEFRLAQLDPNGDCTTGITRVYSPLTTNARQNVKELAYWPSNKYLNVWVVESIENTSGIVGGVVAGFAQFPGGAASTDGIVMRHDYTGTTGTGANPGGLGRTMTHEVGHWLNLRHIWGDEPNCTQDDGVGDTPLQATYSFSTCPTFPFHDACTPGGDGVNFQNYMDYTANDCINMFTQGQASRMHATLSNGLSGRNNLWSASNLTATGTDGAPATLCPPIADFIPRTKFVCEGNAISFKDLSWNGLTTSRTWNFPGAIPSTDTSAMPSVTYPTAGLYDVSLTSSNAAGSNTKYASEHVVVSPLSVPYFTTYVEDFENGIFPFSDWHILNDNGGSGWDQTSIAASSGLYSLTIDNFNFGNKGPDDVITPAFNLSYVTATSMSFDLAFAYQSNTDPNDDKLTVYYSTNCGQTWTARKTISGAALSTVSFATGTDFYPSPSDWRTEIVNLAPTSISTKPNVRFRFEYTHGYGNNIYIDNINITGTVDVNEAMAQKTNFEIYPNPSTDYTYVSFETESDENVKIEISDVTGRIIKVIEEDMPAGEHQVQLENNLSKGVYLVRLVLGSTSVAKRVVMQ